MINQLDDTDVSGPLRRVLTGLSTLAIMFVIYGSWLPFEVDTAALAREGTALLQRLAWVPADFQDVVINLLIFVPVGLLLAMRLRLTRRNLGMWIILPLCVAALTSIIAEVGQTVIAERSPSYTDMVWHGIGALIGVALSVPMLSLLRRTGDQLKMGLALQPQRTLFWIVAALVVFAKLAPFDFTLLSADFAYSLESARWSPFVAPQIAGHDVLEEIVELAGSFFAFALLGILGASALRHRGEPALACVVNTVARLILLAVGVELVQLVIVSHTCDAADVLTYVYGATIGSILGATLLSRRHPDDRSGAGPAAKRVLLTAALAVQCIVVVGYAFPADVQGIAPAETSVHWIPFLAQFNEPYAKAAGQIISSLMWYVTLAAVAWAVLAERAVRHRFAIVGCLTVGLVTLAEAARVFSATHSADVTEPLLALFAWVAASAACHWIDRQRRVEPQEVIRESL